MRFPYGDDACGRRVAYLTLAVLALCAGQAQAQTIVDTCGQTVTSSGVLTADLDCTGFPDNAVVLAKGAKLDLAGFTLTGGDGEGVRCDGTCTVISSTVAKGTITGALEHGITNEIALFPPAQITVRNLVIDGNGGTGVWGRSRKNAKVVVDDSMITNNGGAGVGAEHKVTVRNSVISGNGSGGVGGWAVTVRDSQVNGNGGQGIGVSRFRCRDSSFSGNQLDGISGGLQGDVGSTIKLKNCSADGNQLNGFHVRQITDARLAIKGGSFSGNVGDGIRVIGHVINGAVRIRDAELSNNGGYGFVRDATRSAFDRVQLRGVTINGNGASGVSGRFEPKGLDLSATTVTGNALHGVESLADVGTGVGPCLVRLRKSTLTGNGTDAACGVSVTCADVASCDTPELRSGVCGTDYDTESGFPGSAWGVCGP